MRHALFLLPLLAVLGGAADPAPSAAPVSTAPSAAPVSTALPASPWIPPEERSPKPKPDEWAKAEPLALPRPHSACRATRVREWIRVACRDDDKWLAGARVVAGSPEDVSVEPQLPDPSEPKLEPRWPSEKRRFYHVDVVLPVRRGDRRLIEIPHAYFPGFKSYSTEESAVMMISELWLPGEAAPVVTVH